VSAIGWSVAVSSKIRRTGARVYPEPRGAVHERDVAETQGTSIAAPFLEDERPPAWERVSGLRCALSASACGPGI
jgi:hypothetical protein